MGKVRRGERRKDKAEGRGRRGRRGRKEEKLYGAIFWQHSIEMGELGISSLLSELRHQFSFSSFSTQGFFDLCIVAISKFNTLVRTHINFIQYV